MENEVKIVKIVTGCTCKVQPVILICADESTRGYIGMDAKQPA